MLKGLDRVPGGGKDKQAAVGNLPLVLAARQQDPACEDVKCGVTRVMVLLEVGRGSHSDHRLTQHVDASAAHGLRGTAATRQHRDLELIAGNCGQRVFFHTSLSQMQAPLTWI